MYDRTVAFAVLLVVLLMPIHRFEKISLSSHHWGGTGKYQFTETNPGTGSGVAFGTVAFSHVTYVDSFGCKAENVQLRVSTLPTVHTSFGVALNIALKCWNSDKIRQILLVPTGVYKVGRIVKDVAPRIPYINNIGVIAISEEKLRRPM